MAEWVPFASWGRFRPARSARRARHPAACFGSGLRVWPMIKLTSGISGVFPAFDCHLDASGCPGGFSARGGVTARLQRLEPSIHPVIPSLGVRFESIQTHSVSLNLNMYVPRMELDPWPRRVKVVPCPQRCRCWGHCRWPTEPRWKSWPWSTRVWIAEDDAHVARELAGRHIDVGRAPHRRWPGAT